jgi:hypothetical protein
MEDDFIMISDDDIDGDDFDTLIIYELNSSNIKNISGVNHSLSIYVFDVDDYIKDIYSSYGNNEYNVIKQFEVDFPRQDVFIGGIMCRNIGSYYTKINKLSESVYGKLKCDVLTSMLCNQSSFWLPCELLTRLYNTDCLNVVSRLTTNVKYTLFGLPVHATTIRIVIKDDMIEYILNTKMHIVDVTTDQYKKSINISITFDILLLNNTLDKKIGYIQWDLT